MRHQKFSSVGRDLTQEINERKTYKTELRTISSIAVHCSDSPQGREDDAHTIDRWHEERWGSGIGYHYVVLEDGTIQKGRWVDAIGSHIKGHNATTIGICRIGGMGKDGDSVMDATYEQIHAIQKLTRLLIELYGLTPDDIKGHNEYPNVDKKCPLMKMDRIRNIV